MNEHELDHTLEEFLDLGPLVAPEHVHAAIAADRQATPQARSGWSRWIGPADWRSALSSLSVAVAAVTLLAILGVILFNAGAGLVGGGPTPTFTPTPTPSARPTTPAADATATPEVNWNSADYNPGSHRLTVDGVRFSFTTTSHGWEPYGTVHISKSERGPQGAEGLIYWTAYPEGEAIASCGPWVSAPETDDLDVLSDRMASAPGVEVIEAPTEVTLGGVSGRHLVVSVREDLGCDPGYYFIWRAKTGGALWERALVGDTLRVWLVDLDSTVFFVVADTRADASETLAQDMVEIVNSIRFE